MASSLTEFQRAEAASGRLGKERQLAEFERQLKWLPKWLAGHQKTAAVRTAFLTKKIQELRSDIKED